MSETETSHFWVGRMRPDLDEAYFEEVYDDEDEDREHTPLSLFARDQGEVWYDHDFLEHTCSDAPMSVEKKIGGHSYHEQWGPELMRRVAEAGISEINWIAFISESEVEKPRSVEGDGYSIHYLGTISYRI